MARKSTQRSSRENISSVDSQANYINNEACDEILKAMDSSALIDIKSLQNEILEDKENCKRLSNYNNQVYK